MVAFRATAPDHSRSRSDSAKIARLRVVPRVLRSRHQQRLRIVGRQIELAAELLDVGKIDLDLAGDRDLLPGSVNAGGVQRRDVVNGREIVGRNIVRAAGCWLSVIGLGVGRLGGRDTQPRLPKFPKNVQFHNL